MIAVYWNKIYINIYNMYFYSCLQLMFHSATTPVIYSAISVNSTFLGQLTVEPIMTSVDGRGGEIWVGQKWWHRKGYDVWTVLDL